MKISKVNHVKTGVGINEDHVTGMLYSYPGKKGKEDLKEHVQNVNKSAQRLYSIFLPVNKISRQDGKLYAAITRNFKTVVKVAVLNLWSPKESDELILKKQIEKLRNIQNDKIFFNKQSGKKFSVADQKYDFNNRNETEFIHELVVLSTRASLKRKVRINHEKEIYAPDIIEKLVFAMCQSSNYGQEVNKIPEEELRALLNLINADYGKIKQMNEIVDSIEKQNVKVQYNQETGKLQLTSAGNEKKKYIFEFIRAYAAADDEKRSEMLIHMRQLILLYYCGEEKYLSGQNGDVTEWSFGRLREDSSVNFSDKAMELLQEKAQVLSKEKAKLASISQQLKEELRQTIAQKYRDAVQVSGITKADIFWLQYCEKCAEKILTAKSNISPQKLSVAYLCDQTWKEWISYIAMKYVDMGKAVYHFAMPDLKKIPGQKGVLIGEVLPEYRDGLTSFDYERIKAEETLERELSRYITFAVNNFSQAVLSDEERAKKDQEDVLTIKSTKILYPDTKRRILQYFGGESAWEDVDLENADRQGVENSSNAKKSKKDSVFWAVQAELFNLRNTNFHYTSKADSQNCPENKPVERMFEKEFSQLGAKYRKKYYSNNVPMFYSVENITNLMNCLYDTKKEYPAQIPSFNKVISKPALPEFITRYVKGKNLSRISSDNGGGSACEKFRGALFFVLKEIYYYDFLQSADIKKRFINALGEQAKNEKDKNKKLAVANFKGRIEEINNDSVSFGEICQRLITDYNQQNKDMIKKPSAKEKMVKQKNGSMTAQFVKTEDDGKIYQHFKMLLYICIREAFLTYLKEDEKFAFLREPSLRETEFKNLTEAEFCSGWKAGTFDVLESKITKDSQLRSWYVTAHFLNPKQLNHLIGCVKTYIQYIEEIDRRSKFTKNRVGTNTMEKAAQYGSLLTVLEFCMLFCGQVSNVLTDYFADEEDYAKHLSNFVEWEQEEKQNASTLKAFCDQPVKNSCNNGVLGIYYDGLNPIINRNMIMAMLYGNEKLLSQTMDPVKESEIKAYYKKMADLSKVFNSGICKNGKEQQNLKEFQNMKNRIELVDVMIYSEIVSDLMSQLVSWAYLRERDLMYMQLGFYYIKLFHTDSVEKESWLRTLSGTEIDFADGAVLYQIVAMYSYDLPVYVFGEDGKVEATAKGRTTGSKIGKFVNNYCGKDESIYNAGLCFFEKVKEHEEIIRFRNYIDHFKYYSKMDKSILDLYSQTYESFFTYDQKLKKSVSYVLQNILMKYFVVMDVSFDSYEEKVDTINTHMGKKNVTRKTTRISIGAKGLTSDVFTYKLKPSEKENAYDNRKRPTEVMVGARDIGFLEQLKKILEYKEPDKL